MGKRTRTAMMAAMAALLPTVFSAEGSAASISQTNGNTSAYASPLPSSDEANDSLTRHTRKILVESFGELTKTVNKLSDTALKLMEAQEAIEKKEAEQMASANSKANTAPTQTNQASQAPQDSTDSFTKDMIELTGVTSLPEGFPLDSIVNTAEGVYPTPDSLSERAYNFNKETVGEIIDATPLEGGKYIWIPEGREAEVQALLEGKSTVNTTDEPDLEEMTVWRGDTIPMVLRDRKIGRYDRKLYNWLMYPKGTWQGALTASYGDISTDDSEILSLMKDINISGHIYSIKPAISYFIRNNLSVGLRMAYSKGHAGIETFNVDIDEDMQFNLHDITYDTESYTAAIFMQQYYGLRRMGRFAIYNEVELAFASGNGDFIRPYNDALRQTHWTTTSVNLNFSPGVSILIMKNAAFNLSFGVFGFHLKNERQWENGEESGSRLTSGINFRFNIFNINFGVAITI